MVDRVYYLVCECKDLEERYGDLAASVHAWKWGGVKERGISLVWIDLVDL